MAHERFVGHAINPGKQAQLIERWRAGHSGRATG